MANNYIESSFAIELQTPEEIAWWEAEMNRECPEDLDPSEADPPISHSWEIFKSGDGPKTVWFRHDESIDVNAAADVVQRFLKECRPDGCVGFTWAETCSKPRIGEFGGGACFITAEKQEWMPAWYWLEAEKKKFRENSS